MSSSDAPLSPLLLGPLQSDAFDLPHQCNIQSNRRGSASQLKLKEPHLNLKQALYICMKAKESKSSQLGRVLLWTCRDEEEEEEWTGAVGSVLCWTAWWAGMSPVG